MDDIQLIHQLLFV